MRRHYGVIALGFLAVAVCSLVLRAVHWGVL